MTEAWPCQCKKIWLLLILLILFSVTLHADKQQQDPNAEEHFTDVSLDELMEQKTVISASWQKMNELSVPVAVVTGDRWNLSDSLVLEGEVRGDWYSETQKDWPTLRS